MQHLVSGLHEYMSASNRVIGRYTHLFDAQQPVIGLLDVPVH